MTPHNNAKPGDFAKTVLMPGDPLRSQFIAENFLENAQLVNNVRGVQGYTGTYKGVKVSVMASGMGMPSMGIYSWELFNIIAQGACTDSNWASQYHLPGTFAPIASWDLLRTAVDLAQEKKLPYHVGNVVSSDRFYGDDGDMPEGLVSVHGWAKMGALSVEMETAALYMNAARCGKNALGMFTVSDHLLRKEDLTAEERQTGFRQMMELALDTAVALEK